MSDPLLGVVFGLGIVVSLCFSWVLVTRLERVGARMGLSEGLLGMLAALAADAPEITAAVTALSPQRPACRRGSRDRLERVQPGGAAWPSAVVAGQIALHRRVVELGGAVAMWIAAVCLLVVHGVLSPLLGLLLAVAALGPYVVILGTDHERLARAAASLGMDEVAGPQPSARRRSSSRSRYILAVAALAMPSRQLSPFWSSSARASRWSGRAPSWGRATGSRKSSSARSSSPRSPSLPNAVAAVYLAARGRGAATLSTALNSNALNVAAGLLLPTAILGLGPPSGQTTFVAASYLALTAFALAAAYAGRGLRRPVGMVIIAAYVAFAAVLIAGG